MFKSFEEKNLPGIPASRFARRVATAAFASAVAAMAVLPLTAGAAVGDEEGGVFEMRAGPISVKGDGKDESPMDNVNSQQHGSDSGDNPVGINELQTEQNAGDFIRGNYQPLENVKNKHNDPVLPDGPGETPPKRPYTGTPVSSVEEVSLNSAAPQSVVESASMFIDGIQGHSERLQTKANHLWIDGLASYSHGRDDAYGAGGQYKNGFKSRKAGFVAGYDVDLRDDLVAGAAVSWIRSKYDSKGSVSVENKADTYGIALYSDWQATERLKLGALAGWQRTKGKIHMDFQTNMIVDGSVVPVSVNYESRARTNAFVGSLRAAYDVPVDALTVTPHVGLDLIHAKTRPMDVKLNGNFIGKADFKSHTTWELPLGVRFSSVLDKDGWLIKPEADLMYTAVFGDRRMKFDVIEKSGEISSHDVEFINSNRIGAAVGVSFDNKRDKLFGLHYKVERSDNGLDHQFKLEFVKRF